MSTRIRCILAGISAGVVTGILGSGGGMVLVPLLSPLFKEQRSLFPISLAIMLPICGISLLESIPSAALSFSAFSPYLIGSIAGGLAASFIRGKVPVIWLHRIFGVMLLWGGFRCISHSA